MNDSTPSAGSPTADVPEEGWIDPTERNWFRFSIVLLVAFAVAVGVAGFALGFQVPGDEARVDPRTVADEAPWSERISAPVREIAPGEYVVYMIARQFRYEPNTITVPEGSTVTFYVTSIDVQHGLKIQDTNINLQIVPGQVSKLTTTLDKAGTYPFICHEFCGLGHAGMFGTLTVEAAEG